MADASAPDGGRSPLVYPVLAALGLAAYLLFPAVRAHPVLLPTFGITALLLFGWAAWIHLAARRRGRPLTMDVVIRRPHWIQAGAQGFVLLYWGWWVTTVYGYSPLILAQILVAFAVDALLNLHRRGHWTAGVGPLPVVFSISLFLWFELPWFYWQFGMVALVFFGKEFIRRDWNGRSTHVFNPSALALAVAAVALIVADATEVTQGVAIANSQNIPPFIYVAIFVAALPGQALFGVATMTMTAVLSMWLFGVVYLEATGAFFFYDAYIPIAVFLGMHLLFTDPATSPKSEAGRVLWGILYAVGVIGSAWLLDVVDRPTFYDKLLPVPILNLLAPWLDRIALGATERVRALRPLAVRAGPRRALVTTGLWIVVFGALYGVGGVGDNHPGQYLPWWEEACEEGAERACDYLPVMQQNFCDRGSGWACNEFGIFRATYDGDRAGAAGEFERACALGFQEGCANLERTAAGFDDFLTAPPPVAELPIVLRGSKGEVTERDPAALRALGCERGWDELCRG